MVITLSAAGSGGTSVMQFEALARWAFTRAV